MSVSSLSSRSSDDSFENVLRQLLSCFCASRFHHDELVHQLEARAALSSVKHLSRDHRCHHHHYVIMEDNQGVVLALSNDRCGSFPFLRLSPRICAESLASNIVVHHRRISSEFNRADRLPRLWEANVGGMRSPDPHGMVWWPKAMEAMILSRRCCGNGMRHPDL